MVNFYSHIDKLRVFKHSIFWLVWIASFTVIQSFGYGSDAYMAWLAYYVMTLPLFMAHTYAIAYWLVPKYFYEHRFPAFSFWVICLLILASIGELILSNELVWKVFKPEYIQRGNYLYLSNILINGLGNEYIILVFLSVKVVRMWNSKMGEKTELLNRQLLTEIQLLQYQSYPRFVLNVMDRLEHLAIIRSPQTSEMIIRLSKLMSHMTNMQRKDRITLQKEVEMIRSYSDIQRMNFSKEFEVNFLLTDELNNFQVPPFLFFQLVEEGFNVLDDCSEKSEFTLLFKSETRYLLFAMTLWNPNSFSKQFSLLVMENCRKYLNYFYPENHMVKSSFEINFVEVTIEIYQ